MTPDEGLAACAGLVARGDPGRFRAVMAAPVTLRRILLPLYAFNLEVARAPWVTKEPMLAQIRLQWWRDALAEIADGAAVRRHEVVTPLAAVLDGRGARDLDDLVAARGVEVDWQPFGSEAALTRFLDRTSGTLLWTAARLAGMADEPAARDAGLAQGIAGWLSAAPELARLGRQPFPPGDPEDQIRSLAETGLAALSRFRQARVPAPARPVFLVLSDTGPRLRAARLAPAAAWAPGPVSGRLRFGLAALRGRV